MEKLLVCCCYALVALSSFDAHSYDGLFSYPIPFERYRVASGCELGSVCAGVPGGHAGEDIYLSPGTPVRAIADGRISHYRCRRGYGELLVVIDHNLPVKMCANDGEGREKCFNRLHSIYGHVRNSQNRGGRTLDLKVGAVVKRGDVIGYVNDSDVWPDPPKGCRRNNTTHNGIGPPHLHLGLGIGSYTEFNARGYGQLGDYISGRDFIKHNNVKVRSLAFSRMTGVVIAEGDAVNENTNKLEIYNLSRENGSLTPDREEQNNKQFPVVQIRLFPILGVDKADLPAQIVMTSKNSQDHQFGVLNFPFRDPDMFGKVYYNQYIISMWRRGFINGIADTGFFGPRDLATFSGFIKILSRYIPGAGVQPCTTGTRPSSITDFSEEEFPLFRDGKPWFCSYYNNESINKWVGELLRIDPASARPSRLIRRKEVAFFLATARNLQYVIGNVGAFSDVTISDPFYNYIERCKISGVFAGYNDGSFRPDEPITRGDLAKVMELAFFSPDYVK